MARRPPDADIDAADAAQLDMESSARLHEGDTPEHLALRDEIKHTISQTIDELPEELRIAIVLCELEGLSYEEIAETMNCPIGTVRSRIFRAREAIDRKLRPLLE